MQRLKDKELKRKHLLKRGIKDSDSDKKKLKIPRNIRTRKSLRFQIPGTNLKFCKNTPLTAEIKRIFGRRIFQIIPEEMKQPGCVPILSMYIDKENRAIVWHVDLVEHEDYIVQDETGEAKFVPDTEYRK